MKDHEANTVAQHFVTQFVCLHGQPESLVTDCGTEFLSKVFKEVCKLLKISQTSTTPYHPQSNGSLERSHRTLGEYLRNYSGKNPQNWDVYVPYAMYCHNSSVHTSTGFQPHEVVYGYPLSVPNSLSRKPEPQYNYQDYQYEMKRLMQETHQMVTEQQMKSKQKSQERYYRTAVPLQINEGDKVIVQEKASKGKLAPKWLGPFTVVETNADSPNVTILKKNKHNSSGLYFEAMEPLRISYTTWDFVTYVNLTTYYMKYQILQKFHDQTGDVCIQLKKREDSILTSACTDFIQSTFPFMQEIESNFNSVIRILGSNHRTSEHPNRQPRGLINAVGRLANILFGVCSDKDAEFFYKNIEDLARSEDKHVHLSQEQIRIVSSVMNNVNSTMHELLADDQKLQKNINKIEEQSRRSVATINVLEIQNTFLEHTAILTVFLNQFAWETQNLQSIVNSALNGLMHTNVYPPSKLIHELKQIQLTLPSTLELPITESHLSIPELFRTSKLSVVYIQQNLVFVTRIPLLSNLRFNLFHNIPLPIPTNKGNIVIIEPQAQYLTISDTNEYHFSLTDDQYEKCETLFSFRLCVNPEAISKFIHQENCELSLYNSPFQTIGACNFKYLNLNNTIWHKLYLQNAWLYYCISQAVTVTCAQNSSRILLTGTGKIQISDNCVIYTENLILTPSRTLSSEIHKDFVPENPKLHAMLKIPELINSHVPEQVDTNKYFKNFNQLAEDAEKLKELSKMYNDTKIFVNPDHHFIIVYIIFIFIIAVSLYMLIKYKCNLPRLYRPEVAECVQPIHSSINSKSFRASELTDEVKHGDH
ncbi:hypothetical protein QTP88_023603 [Uroleucon formosanum]